MMISNFTFELVKNEKEQRERKRENVHNMMM